MWQGKSSFALSMWLDFDPARALQTVFSATSSSGAAEFTVELRKWNNNNLFYPQISFKGYQFWFNYPISSSGWQHLTVSVEQRNVCVYINGGSSECVDFGSGTGTLSLNKMVLGQKIHLITSLIRIFPDMTLQLSHISRGIIDPVNIGTI